MGLNRASGLPVLWAAGAVFATALVFFGLYFDYGLAVFDEGVLLEGIRLEAQGRMDFVQFCHYSSQYRWFALLFPDGRPNLEVVRGVFVLVRAATAALIFLIAAPMAGRRWAVVPVLLFLALPGPWHKAWVGLLVCLCLHAVVTLADQPTRRRYAWFAVCLAFAYAVHPYTAVLTLAGWVLLALLVPVFRSGPDGSSASLRDFLAWHGTFLVTLVAATVLLADSVREVNPMTLGVHNAGLTAGIASGTRFFVAQLVGGLHRPSTLLLIGLYGTVFVTLGIGVWMAVRANDEPDGRAWMTRTAWLSLVVIGAANLPKWLVRLDLAHLLQNAAPIWILMTVIAACSFRKCGRRRSIAVALVGWIVVLLGWGLSSADTFVGGIGMRFASTTVDLEHPFGTMHVPARTADKLERLKRAIQDHSKPGEPVLICAYPKILYYLSERHSPLIVPVIAFPSSTYGIPDETLAAELRRTETAVVLLADEPVIPREDFRLNHLAPALFRAIMTDYESVDDIDGIDVRIRRATGPSG